mmetsp:Transcript_16832/g.42991  ORF Transcript_16832/g.42991 Transcript_16832/m.42991 type:complete len:214 (-) Transcript_16832:219-860(-)
MGRVSCRLLCGPNHNLANAHVGRLVDGVRDGVCHVHRLEHLERPLPCFVVVHNLIVRRVAQQLSLAHAWGDANKPDVVLAGLFSNRLREAMHSKLCGTVHCVVGEGLSSSNRAHINDGSRLAFDHAGKYQLCAIQQTSDVHAHHGGPLIGVLFRNLTQQHHTCIVDHDLRGAKLLFRFGHSSSECIIVGDVDLLSQAVGQIEFIAQLHATSDQ